MFRCGTESRLGVVFVLAVVALTAFKATSAPKSPDGMDAVVLSGTSVLTLWNDNSDNETKFRLFRKVPGVSGFKAIAVLGADTVEYVDTGLTPGTRYCYRVAAKNGLGQSAFSPRRCITVDRPRAPTRLAAQWPDAGTVDVIWKDKADNEDRYKLERQLNGGSWSKIANVSRDGAAYSDNAVLAGNEYCYRVRAKNALGHSSYSNTDCVTPGIDVTLAVQSVAAGLTRPVFVTAPFNDDRLFIIEQGGLIKIVSGGALLPTPFLDLSALVTCCGERGLLGLAFPVDYATTGLFYVNYSDASGNTVIARYQVSADPNVADAGSAEILLTVVQPRTNHNGGTVAFGLDGYLYIGMGDGGGGGDPDNLAQNDATLLGKMLRIDVSGGLGSGYSIPPSNPYAGGALPLPEIWAKGLRNPYRFSFDRVAGDLYIADVGQGSREEIDVEPYLDPGGRNYGWRLMEGFFCFNPSSGCNDGTLTLPVFDYGHTDGRCSVTGGHVYRGSIAEIFGHYFFADFCAGEVRSFRWDGGGGVVNLMDWTTQLQPAAGFSRITAIGEDGHGELYIVQFGFAGNGEVFRIVKQSP